MFDSVVNVMRPGKLGVWGFPWHGQVNALTRAGGGSSPLQLTLPNAAVMTLTGTVPNPSASFEMYGNCRVFCDPRAVDAELTPEQQAAATAAGATWRKEELISELGACGGVITEQLIYHDGAKNWAVVPAMYPNQTTVVRGLPVIARSYTRPQHVRPATHHYTTAQLSPAGLPYSSTRWYVLDSERDGTRHLIGFFGARSGRATYAAELYAVVELVLSGPGDTVRADYYLRYSYADMYRNQTTSQSDNRQGFGLFVSQMYWSAYVNGAPVTSVVDVEKVPATNSPLFYEGATSASESAERIVSAHYDAAGEIELLTLSYSNSRSSSYSLSLSTTETPARGIGVSSGYYAVELVAPGEHRTSVVESYTHTAELEVSLKLGGITVSTVSGTGSASRTHTYVHTTKVEADELGYASAGSSISGGVSLNWTHDLSHDSHSLHSASGSETGPVGSRALRSPSFAFGSAAAGYPGAISMSAGTDNSPPEQQVSIFTVMYNAGMHALATQIRPAGSTAAQSLRIGAVVARGALVPGSWSGAAPNRALYGAYNPLTGEAVRDRTLPVFYL